MELVRDPDVLARMVLAFDLYEAAEEIVRQNLRRRDPGASEEEIEEGVRRWLRRRPGAEHGDAVGRPAHRFDEAASRELAGSGESALGEPATAPNARRS